MLVLFLFVNSFLQFVSNFHFPREDDKKILQLYQSRSSSENIYSEIAHELGNKTAEQVVGFLPPKQASKQSFFHLK